MEVFQLIGNGYATRQIAERLNLSVKTIDSYREHLKLKLNLDSGADLVRYAIQWVKAQDTM
jgi:DNA-binding NarL/FixJ family response regulator